MTSNKSKNHHWWPVALQSYWANRHGDLSWVEPDGSVHTAKPKNRKIAFKRYGHTVFRRSVWESNFESEFEIDSEVHNIILGVRNLKPLGRAISDFPDLIRLFGKKDRRLADLCKFYHVDEKLHRDLLLLVYSILIRSPANRSRYEGYPEVIGLPPDEEVGKYNIAQNYRIAKRLCESGFISNQYFIFLHSPFKRFIFGDGCLDWLTSNLIANRIGGRALLPLTPHICLYFCTPMSMRSTPNCASLSVAPWMVDWVNQSTQIYSKGKLFFTGKPPKLSPVFYQNQFLQHKEQADEFIDMLDEIAGVRRWRVSRFHLARK